MRYLLDTHAIIWYFEDSQELPDRIFEIIDNDGISVYISSVSLWEIALKINLGKLDMQLPLYELLNHIKKSDFTILQIEDEYLNGLATLPTIHKDPFDRMIISSAIANNLTIITVDDNIHKYNVPWVW